MYVNAGTITSSFFFKFNDFKASISASVPDAQPTEYLIFDSLEKLFSKIFTDLPRIKSFFKIILFIFFLIIEIFLAGIGSTSVKIILLVSLLLIIMIKI